MSDTIDEHKTVTKDGYVVTLHPAFSSGCSVRAAGDGAEEKVLYKQEGKHVFKTGQSHPKKHVFRLKGGQHNRDLELEIRDPKHQVARITVEFYAEGHEPGWGSTSTSEPVEIVSYENNGTTCPPDCDGLPDA